MASINIRIDDDLKTRAYRELEKLGVTPSELMRQALQYVAERGQLPFKTVLVTECSGQLIPDTALSFSSATAGAKPSLN